MIKLITRKEALENQYFAYQIASWQKRYDPKEESYMRTEGEYYDDEMEEYRFFTQQELEHRFKEELKEFDKYKDDIKPDSSIKYIEQLLFKIKKVEGMSPYYEIELGNKLELLSNELNEPFIFLTEYPIPWLARAKEEYIIKHCSEELEYFKYFEKIGIANDFTGGILASGDELNLFIQDYFKLIEMNLLLPYTFFHVKNLPIVFSLCKYGALHVDVYQNNKHGLEIQKLFSILKMKKVNECHQEVGDWDHDLSARIPINLQ